MGLLPLKYWVLIINKNFVAILAFLEMGLLRMETVLQNDTTFLRRNPSFLGNGFTTVINWFSNFSKVSGRNPSFLGNGFTTIIYISLFFWTNFRRNPSFLGNGFTTSSLFITHFFKEVVAILAFLEMGLLPRSI